jgi:hypothetical protein
MEEPTQSWKLKLWKRHLIPPPSVAIHVKKKDIYLGIVRRNEKGFPPL